MVNKTPRWLKKYFETAEFLENGLCLDCKKNCRFDAIDSYMLKNELWELVNPNLKGMLCMKCVEKRLDRPIVKDDLSECRLNRELNPYTSAIMNSG